MSIARTALRVVVRTLGELCITAGVVLALFLVWQLWWTDIVADREQTGAVLALTQAFEATSEPAPPDSTSIPRPAPGDAFAIVRIPRFGADFARPVIAGTGRDVLARGVGHYDGAALPGEVGNFAIAGHRTTYGAPFNAIADLRPGDAIVVETSTAYHLYAMAEHTIVRPWQGEVIAPVPGQPGAEPTEAWLTMTSCHPMWSARERFVVHAELVRSVPRAETTLDEILGGT